MYDVDHERTLSSVESRINATDEPITMKDRHHIIAKAALMFWSVDLTLIREVEELLRALPITNQIIEGRYV